MTTLAATVDIAWPEEMANSVRSQRLGTAGFGRYPELGMRRYKVLRISRG
jgi:hypothetical protein